MIPGLFFIPSEIFTFHLNSAKLLKNYLSFAKYFPNTPFKFFDIADHS